MKLLQRLSGALVKKKGESVIPVEFRKKIRLLEKRMGYFFRNPSLLEQALTHPSFNEHTKGKEDNQRLEFLGDAILGGILSLHLYELYPNDDEGSLSRKKAVLARGSTLASLGSKLGLPEALQVSRTERKNQGHLRPSTLEDAIEAIIGAIYLDGGWPDAQKCVLRWLGDVNQMLEAGESGFNPKGQLQEFVQSQNPEEKIKYHLVREEGPPHDKRFLMQITIGGAVIAQGSGKSKKEAEEKAAGEALTSLKSEHHPTQRTGR